MNKLSGAETAPLLFRISGAARLEFGIWPRLTQSQERNGENWEEHMRKALCACFVFARVFLSGKKTLLAPRLTPPPLSATHKPQGERSLLVHHFIVYTRTTERTTVAEKRKKKPPERFMSLPAHLLCIAAV